MIEHASGSIFDADVQALVNPVNCVGIAGKGLAAEFKRRYPDNHRSYVAACKDKRLRPGRVLCCLVRDSTPSGLRTIANFATKDHWRAKSDLAWIERGLRSLVETAEGLNIRSIAIPALGCGLGGLLWDDVRPLIEAAANEMPDVRVVVFPPQS